MHTGNTHQQNSAGILITVHPRAYGEHTRIVISFFKPFGSSPCIRGTHVITLMACTYIRFIPVHTGNTFYQVIKGEFKTVHPRAYGEHDNKKITSSLNAGSSPCIRGTRKGVGIVIPNCRFIPVHTGNTNPIILVSPYFPVHPRAYGEHRYVGRNFSHPNGSSPCIRGTQQWSDVGMGLGWFIPVHTGNTC